MITLIVLPYKENDDLSATIAEFITKLNESLQEVDIENEVQLVPSSSSIPDNEEKKIVIICSGSSCPESFETISTLHRKCLLVAENPEFRPDIRNKLSRIECPVLLLSSADTPWDFRKDSISFHDLISGSVLINVRSSLKHPLFRLNTQAFNAAVGFIRENIE